jgi:hypothetical protein
MYKFTPPPADDADTAEKITLALPADTEFGVPSDPERWKRSNGQIVATYTHDELAWAVALALEQQRAEIEKRLERGLTVLRESEGSDADELLAHWGRLNTEYEAVTSKLADVLQSLEESDGGER